MVIVYNMFKEYFTHQIYRTEQRVKTLSKMHVVIVFITVCNVNTSLAVITLRLFSAALREHKEEIDVHKEKGHVALREHIEVGKDKIDDRKEKGHAALREHIEIGKEEIKNTTGTVKMNKC